VEEGSHPEHKGGESDKEGGITSLQCCWESRQTRNEENQVIGFGWETGQLLSLEHLGWEPVCNKLKN
jgi:hypothetical protein